MKLKDFFAGITAAAMIFSTAPTSAENWEEGEVVKEVPTEIYMWVQSTARANYWFNHQAAGYRIKEDGTLDLNILMVPAVYLYDNVQIEDVIQKRRWRNLSTSGYNKLVGRSELLKFDLKNMTVQVVEKTDLDDTWGELDKDTSGEPVELKSFSSKDVMFKFYRTILNWARTHNELIIGRSKGVLSKADGDLPINEVPINKIFIPPAEY